MTELAYTVTRAGLHPVQLGELQRERRGMLHVQGFPILDDGRPAKIHRWFLPEHLHATASAARSAYAREFGRMPRKVRGVTRPRPRQLPLFGRGQL